MLLNNNLYLFRSVDQGDGDKVRPAGLGPCAAAGGGRWCHAAFVQHAKRGHCGPLLGYAAAAAAAAAETDWNVCLRPRA
jgi:hypothetical protein